jgi:hypothetical protein
MERNFDTLISGAMVSVAILIAPVVYGQVQLSAKVAEV